MRTAETFDKLLAGFRALEVQVGQRQFDLRWHDLSAIPATWLPDKDGGGTVDWGNLPAERWPFDPAKRLAVGRVCLPFDNRGERFTLGTDAVTILCIGAAAEPLRKGEGTIAGRFRELSARAGAALPGAWREWLSRYISVLDRAPANWWYALLFALFGHDAQEGIGGSGSERELVLATPLRNSVEAIERLGLNTPTPKSPETVFAADDRASIARETAVDDRTNPKKPKKSTEPGEARVKIIAALTNWHKYRDGGCLNTEPVGVNALAKAARVANGSVSNFFEEKFTSHAKYRALCRRPVAELTAALRLLNNEFAPKHLFPDGRTPPGEGPDDEEE